MAQAISDMIIEQLYHSSEKWLNEVKQIYLDSFPTDERRPFSIVRRYLKCSRRPFHIVAAVKDDKVASFISYWDFPAFRYIEHFATVPSLRGDGIGSRLLREFLNQSPLPVILEVELPDNDLAKRRIEYYTRQGFRLLRTFRYIQPPYSTGKNPLEMKIMTFGNIDADDLPSFVAQLYKQVYNVKD